MAGHLTGRCALIMEYDGSAYAGFQYQINADTIQHQLELALSRVFNCRVSVRSASRTDSGVHARGQVVAMNLPRPFPSSKLIPAINWHLPRDIRITHAFLVPQDFDPRTGAKGKVYRYFIFNRSQTPAIGAAYSWHIPQPLDLPAMISAAAACRGCHDFISFQAAGSPVKDTVRTIRHLTITRYGPMLTITCVGDGFLYNMVRIIVGTLVEIGQGKRKEPMAEIIAARNRAVAGATAPPRGLFLERVLYRPSLDSYPRL